MKTLQNNFTTPDQSKQLLELGVPADSADCVRVVRTGMVFFMQNGKVTKGYLSLYKAVRGKEAEPCWSVGRLMEIIRICNLIDEKPWVCIEQDNISAMIIAITDGVNNYMLDFSKLEE